MNQHLGWAQNFAETYEFRINSGRHDAQLQEHSHMQTMQHAALAHAEAQERIAAALERIAERLEALTSAAGNLKVETPS